MNVIICVVFIIFILILIVSTKSLQRKSETIYCVMVTGKDAERLNFGKIAINNFNKQTYKNKRLIIINEGDALNEVDKDILEIVVSNRKEKGLTLGDLRNMAFEFIPEDALWTLWDDDDWRQDIYLTTLQASIKKNDYVFFTKRIEYNLNNGFSWVMELKTGFVILFGRKNWRCKYESKDFNEDVSLKSYIMKNLNYVILKNDPKIYIRTIHKNNTSVLVKKSKDEIADTKHNKVYHEYAANKDETSYANNIINLNFEKNKSKKEL